MRYLRVVIVILFILSAGVFGYSVYVKNAGKDTVPPVISGSSETLMLESDYTEEDLLKELTASDKKDGDLIDKIMIGSVSRFHSIGKFKITYVVFDSSNNPGTFTREAEITDYTSPVFTLSESLVYAEGNSQKDISSYIGAYDAIDGDISSSVRITDTSVNFKSSGDYKIYVECSNSFGDTQQLSLPVHIVESADLRIKINLSENLVYVDKGSKFEPNKCLSSVEPVYGIEIGNDKVKIESGVKTDTAGCYEVKYTVDGPSGTKGTAWLTVVVR